MFCNSISGKFTADHLILIRTPTETNAAIKNELCEGESSAFVCGVLCLGSLTLQ
jgi:hypothetical protein